LHEERHGESAGGASDDGKLALARSRREYALRVVVTIAIIAAAYALWRLTELILLLFAALLFAILFRSLADAVARRVPLSPGWSLGLVILLLVVLGIASFSLFGDDLQRQLALLVSNLPAAWQSFQLRLSSLGIGQSELGWLSRHLSFEAGLNQLARLAGELTGLAAGLLLAVIGGVYLAAQPDLYRRGLLSFAPRSRRAEMQATLHELGVALRYWLVGQLTTMVIVGVLTGLGAALIGLPSAAALGLIAAFLEFVPYLGPIATAVPALLLALTLGIDAALGTLVMLIVVQQLEGYVLTPLIQRRVVLLPPALTLFSLFGMGALFGVLGVLLATPLTVCLFVLVRRAQSSQETHAASG
jgi:predicted PurR-regulated permease PerM